MATPLFKQSKSLESEVESFLDSIAKGAMVFLEGVKHYLEKDQEAFEENLRTISQYENDADNLRRDIRQKLYQQMLIPESRGDVLGLLENMDNVIDVAKEGLYQFDIEIPEIPEEFKNEFIELTDLCVKAADALVMATRAFFKDVTAVNHHINQVMFYEKEADKTEYRLKKNIYRCESLTKLSVKNQLRHFVQQIAKLADESEAVAERLSVYSIKRSF